jgi:hypothetical protein
VYAPTVVLVPPVVLTGVAVVIEFDALDALDVPLALVAVTVNV